MSANLDLVRSIFAAWERADYSTTDWAHGEIEFVIAEGPSPGRWTGLAEMAEGYRDWLTAWEAYRVKADEYRELDSERVLVLVRSTGRGKTSGLELGQIQSKGEPVCSTSAAARSRGTSSTGTASARSPTSASLRRPMRPVRTEFQRGIRSSGSLMHKLTYAQAFRSIRSGTPTHFSGSPP